MGDMLQQGGEMVFLILLDIAKALYQKLTLFTFPGTRIGHAAEKLYLCDNERGHMFLCFSLSLFSFIFKPFDIPSVICLTPLPIFLLGCLVDDQTCFLHRKDLSPLPSAVCLT